MSEHPMSEEEFNSRLDAGEDIYSVVGDDRRRAFETRLDRIEQAIVTLAFWLVQAQTGFSAKDAAGIRKILFPDSNGDKRP